MSKDKIIQFPGARAAAPGPSEPHDAMLARHGALPGGYIPPAEPAPGSMDPTKTEVVTTADGQQITLTPQQQKALHLVLSGTTFVMIGIKPAPTGADFFTAVHGDHGDLRNALDHLYGVIERAYVREGITQ